MEPQLARVPMRPCGPAARPCRRGRGGAAARVPAREATAELLLVRPRGRGGAATRARAREAATDRLVARAGEAVAERLLACAREATAELLLASAAMCGQLNGGARRGQFGSGQRAPAELLGSAGGGPTAIGTGGCDRVLAAMG